MLSLENAYIDWTIKHKLLIHGMPYRQKIVVPPQEVIEIEKDKFLLTYAGTRIAHAIRLTELLLQILPFVENT